MFEDIAEMEKEIETFRKNILASSELVEGISSLIEETKKQKEGLSASTSAIIKELESAIAQFKADHGDSLRELSKNNESLVRQLQQSIADEQRHSLSEISKIQHDMKESLDVSAESAQKNLKDLSNTGEKITSAFHQDSESIKSTSTAQMQKLASDNAEAMESLHKNIIADQENQIAEIKKVQTLMQSGVETFTAKADAQVSAIIENGKDVASAFHQDSESIKSTSTAQMQKLASDNAEAMESLHKNIIADQEKLISELGTIQRALETCVTKFHEDAVNIQTTSSNCVEQFNSDCQRVISDAKQSMDSLHSKYSQTILQTETVIKAYQDAAEKKYNEFVERLERTNVDQIFKEVQELKQSVKIKFTLLMCGIGATLAVNIVLLLLR